MDPRKGLLGINTMASSKIYILANAALCARNDPKDPIINNIGIYSSFDDANKEMLREFFNRLDYNMLKTVYKDGWSYDESYLIFHDDASGIHIARDRAIIPFGYKDADTLSLQIFELSSSMQIANAH